MNYLLCHFKYVRYIVSDFVMEGSCSSKNSASRRVTRLILGRSDCKNKILDINLCSEFLQLNKHESFFFFKYVFHIFRYSIEFHKF